MRGLLFLLRRGGCAVFLFFLCLGTGVELPGSEGYSETKVDVDVLGGWLPFYKPNRRENVPGGPLEMSAGSWETCGFPCRRLRDLHTLGDFMALA